MATYTPIPYFASAPVPLPSYEEIVARQSSTTLGQKFGRNIVKIGEHFVVKYGKHVEFLEGENMLAIRRHTSIPIPTLYAMYHHGPTGDNVIIMEYVEGEVLSSCYHKLDAKHIESVGAQLRRHLDELRKIPSPGSYCSLGGRPYLPQDWIFKSQAGPFKSDRDFFETYFNAHFSDVSVSSRPYLEKLKFHFLEMSRGYTMPVFTHGDLQAQNIVLRKDGSICIIDWESASFCPEYFEFFIHGTYNMAVAGLSKSDKHPLLGYAGMVKLIIEMWNASLSHSAQ